MGPPSTQSNSTQLFAVIIISQELIFHGTVMLMVHAIAHSAPCRSIGAPAFGTAGKAAPFQKEEWLWDTILAVFLKNYRSQKSTCKTIRNCFVGLWLERILASAPLCMFVIILFYLKTGILLRILLVAQILPVFLSWNI